MKQFYETYKDNLKLSPLVTQISWINKLLATLWRQLSWSHNRSLIPAVIAEYETKFIPKEVLRKKFNEFYEHLEAQGDE